ncbi:MAG: hypothetical protein Q9M21_01490 [Mariprofundaceae bacterium]|nr:hypothetical protein [Mariprofundaceae bacterium]
MLVSCPQCKAKYQLATTIKNAVLVCHRCGAEFHTNQPEKEHSPAYQEASLFEYTKTSSEKVEPSTLKVPASNEPTLPPEQTDKTNIHVEQVDTQPSDTEQISVEQTDIPHIQLSKERLLPERGQTHIWYWLILVLLCISGLGIWNNQKQWLAQPWVRSLMMNMQVSIASNPADWDILKNNIHSQWIDRQDDSRVLFIDGYIQNRLLSDQIPPAIQINFFDMPNSRAIQTRTLAITEPPSLPTIRHAPYIAPAIDQVPISAGGKRAFTLIIENVPEQAREISMVIATPKTALIGN